MDSFICKVIVEKGQSGRAVDILAGRTDLSRQKIKDAMQKGAVWLTPRNRRVKRVRRAQTELVAGDRITLYYDRNLLELLPPRPECFFENTHYSVWNKPAGLLAQGTMYGDHCSLLRQAELFFTPRRLVFLVHRLDREAGGLMLLAHNRKMAARFSDMFRENKVHRLYRVTVRGNLAEVAEQKSIDFALDGKEAKTEYALLGYDPERDESSAEVSIKTGRLHQIRRHFHMLGHPVIGDPKYGRNNKNDAGMQLKAVRMFFLCPVTGAKKEFSLL